MTRSELASAIREVDLATRYFEDEVEELASAAETGDLGYVLEELRTSHYVHISAGNFLKAKLIDRLADATEDLLAKAVA